MKLMKSEKGLTLIEVIVSLGLLGIIVIAFLGAMAGASIAMFIADEQATAESLSRSQMEYVKNQEYDDEWNYTISTSERIPSDEPSWWDLSNDIPPLLSSEYTGYSATINAYEIESGPQKITILVYHNGKPVISSGDFTLEGYKIDR